MSSLMPEDPTTPSPSEGLGSSLAVPDFPSPRRGTTISALLYSSANVVELTMRVAAGVVTARIIGPSILGKFAGAALVLGYIPAALGGVPNGLGRDLPFFLGAGERDFALGLAAVAKAWSIAVGLVCLCGCFVVSAYYAFRGNLELSSVWATNAISAFVLCYAQQYLFVIYRTKGDFSNLSRIKVLQGIAVLAGTIAIWAWKFEGLCLRALSVTLLTGLLMWYRRPMKITPHWNGRLFLLLLRTGIPIYLVGQLTALWPVINNTLVFAGTGSKGLGLYAISSMAVAGATAIVGSFANVVYPRMTEEYGQSRNPHAALRIAIQPTALLVLIMLVYLVCGVTFLGPVVRLLMPKYVDGIGAARWAIVAASVLALTLPLNFFAVVKKLSWYAICMGCGMMCYVVMVYSHPRARASLEFYPKAMALGTIVYLVASYATLFWVIQSTDWAK